jgi:hypothetical protein
MTATDRRCPNGHPIEASAAYCSVCGVRTAPTPGGSPTCANGHDVSPGDTFCTQCGATSQLVGATSGASSIPPPPPGFASAGPYGVGTAAPPYFPPPYAPQYAPPPSGYAPPYATPYAYAPPPTTSGLAIASLVASLCFFCGVNVIVGLVLGIVALHHIKTTNQNGRGLAIAGIVISAVQLFLFVAWLIVFLVLGHVGSVSSSSTSSMPGPLLSWPAAP